MLSNQLDQAIGNAGAWRDRQLSSLREEAEKAFGSER